MTEIADDYAGDDSTTGRVAVGGTASGEVEASLDRDWFRVRLTEGRSYAIDLQGADSGLGSLYDPYLRLYDGSGHVIAENDDWNSYDSHVEITADRTGYYYVDAGDVGWDTGTYELSVSRIDTLLS